MSDPQSHSYDEGAFLVLKTLNYDAPALVPAYLGSACDSLVRALKVCDHKADLRRLAKVYNMAAALLTRIEARR